VCPKQALDKSLVVSKLTVTLRAAQTDSWPGDCYYFGFFATFKLSHKLNTLLAWTFGELSFTLHLPDLPPMEGVHI